MIINGFNKFRGVHNAVKTKAWLILWEAEKQGMNGLCLKQLCRYGDFNYHSLATLLTRWYRWGFICPVLYCNGSRYWVLKPHAMAWLRRWAVFMPLEAYNNELKVDVSEALIELLPDGSDNY